MSDNKIELSGIFSEGYGIIPKKLMRMQFKLLTDAESRNIKLVLAYMLSYTGSGNSCFPSIDRISADLNMSRTTVIETLKKAHGLELIDKKKMYPNDPLKQNNKYRLTFLESQNLNFHSSESELSRSGNLTLEVQNLDPNNNSINNNKINNKKTKQKKEKPKKIKHKYSEFVQLTEEQYKKLEEKYGDQTNYVISYFNNAKAAKGYKYKSDYHAILQWKIDINEINKKNNIPHWQKVKNEKADSEFQRILKQQEYNEKNYIKENDPWG